MANSPSGEDNPHQSDKRAVSDKDVGSSGLSFRDVVSETKDDNKPNIARDNETSSQKNVNDNDISGRQFGTHVYSLGQKPQFYMRKSEFLEDKIDKPLSELKPLVDKFLQETPGRKETSLTKEQRHDLDRTREALARVTSAEDALATALDLAKLYQHLRCIEEAKKATDLSLGIDPENHFGKQLFKELEHIHGAEIAYREDKRTSCELTKSSLRQRISAFDQARVIVLGDLVIDEFLEGSPERISREAPVLILEHIATEHILGGAANAANNVAKLGGACHAIGVCGKDQYADKLAELFDRSEISHGLVVDPARPTTVKTRVLSKAHSFKQQLLRLDRMSHKNVGSVVEALLVERLMLVADSYSAVVLSDYRGGVICDALTRVCQKLAREQGKIVIVDAQDRLERFQDLTILTPNEPDVEQALGYALDSMSAIRRAGKDLFLLTGSEAILITRGAKGMTLFMKEGEFVELPPFNKREVFDVTGAGDTVSATIAVALSTGASFLEAAALGNLAAGIVITKPGTATTGKQEMLSALEEVDLPD